MTHKITLILILHNRHKNLDRLLEYYHDYDFPIIIADSSEEKHTFNTIKSNWVYHYSHGLTFTQKIEQVSEMVTTPYVVMCADDDFIFPEALKQCISFLEQNKSYSVAQGWCIRYYKESIVTNRIRFGLLYDFSECIEEDEVLKRLKKMFKNYRSLLYAVFKTEVLQQSFAGAGNQVKNLFLNEYVTAFLPVMYGKYKELSILYQVREFAEDSDDKTTINIDILLENHAYSNELKSFKNYILDKMINFLHLSYTKAEKTFDECLQLLSTQVKANRNQKISLKKRVGKMISIFPFIGKKMINKNREMEAAKQLQSVIKTHSDKEELNKIAKLLIKFQ